MSMGKYLHKNKIEMNISIRIAAVLVCLTLLSTYFVSGLFARYATSGQGDDSARAAKFSIEGKDAFLQKTIEANLIPGGKESVDLQIENNSEVAVEYTVTVTNKTTNLPLNFWMKKTGGSTVEAADDEITFTGRWLPGSNTDKYTLYIEWKADKKDSTLMGKVDYIMVTVTAAQID